MKRNIPGFKLLFYSLKLFAILLSLRHKRKIPTWRDGETTRRIDGESEEEDMMRKGKQRMNQEGREMNVRTEKAKETSPSWQLDCNFEMLDKWWEASTHKRQVLSHRPLSISPRCEECLQVFAVSEFALARSPSPAILQTSEKLGMAARFPPSSPSFPPSSSSSFHGRVLAVRNLANSSWPLIN